jgi:hypothetical protein
LNEEPYRELQQIAERARSEFLARRNRNPLLYLPLVRDHAAREIAADMGADSAATERLVADYTLGKKKPDVGNRVARPFRGFSL